MRRVIGSMIILPVLAIYGVCWAGTNDPYRTRGWLNGHYWSYLTREKNHEAKMAYILGVMDGINISNAFTEDDAKSSQLDNLIQGSIPLQVKEALDTVFGDPPYKYIPIYVVMILEFRKMKNVISLRKYDESLKAMRETYSK